MASTELEKEQEKAILANTCNVYGVLLTIEILSYYYLHTT